MFYNPVLILALLVALTSAGTLYGISTPGKNRLNVYKVDPTVGKATSNVTSLQLPSTSQTCQDNLLLSFSNITQELAFSCDDSLYYVNLLLSWDVHSFHVSSAFGVYGPVVNIVPSWRDSSFIREGNCALVLNQASSSPHASMGVIACFSYDGGGTENLHRGPGPYQKIHPFVFADASSRIGIFNYIGDEDKILWGQSTVDGKPNLVHLTEPMLPWNSFSTFDLPKASLNGSTSYSHPLLNNLVVIELTNQILVLDLTTKTLSNPITFCAGHTKIGSSAFDPLNHIMYSIVSCTNGPMLITFDIQNAIVKLVVKFDSSLGIKGLVYTF